MASVAVIKQETHGDLRVKNQPDYSIAKGQNVLPVVVQEFVAASIEFPILFVKVPEGKGYQAIILTGLNSGESLFTNGENWTGYYQPKVLWNPPFTLARGEGDSEELSLEIDTDHPLVSRDDGELLYDGKGEMTAYHQARRRGLIEYNEFSQVTIGFTEMLVHLDLLTEQPLTVEVKGNKINLQGLSFVDEEKLNALSQEAFLDLRKRGFLPVIYAQMTSMNNLYRLMKMANEI